MSEPSHDALVHWQRLLEYRLARFAETELRNVTARVGVPGVHDAAATYLTRPSKRLMGMAFLHAASGLGVSAEEHDLIEVAAALEIRHGAVLLHDDIADGDTQRGGHPTAHCALATPFDTEEARSAAVFAGDILAGLAPLPILRSGLAPAPRLRLGDVFSATTARVAAGQIEQLSLDVRTDPELVTEEEILRIHGGHFIPYLLCSIDLAGVLYGLDDVALERLRVAGRPLCQGFQVQNDLAGFTELIRVLDAGESTESALTMANTSDLARRRRTVLVRDAMDRLPDGNRRRLVSFLAGTDAETDLYAAARLVRSSGAVEHCAALVQELHEQARQHLAKDTQLPDAVRVALGETWGYTTALYDPASPISRLYVRARADLTPEEV